MSNYLFGTLASLCERVTQEPLAANKRRYVYEYISKLDRSVAFGHLRLLLPQWDRARGAYGIKESKLAQLYIHALSLGSESADAWQLRHYRQALKNAGDFAAVAYQVIRSRVTVSTSTVTIDQVNDWLDQLVLQQNKDSIVVNWIGCTTALEQKWLIRIILKDLKLTVGDVSILRMYHPDAESLYNVSGDLQRICQELVDPSVRVASHDIALMRPFKPMLAERGNHLPDTVKQMTIPFVIETKLDGERVQLHKEGNRYRYFSRNLHEQHDYGIDSNSGSLTPFIHNLFSETVQSVILDGEMMVYNENTDEMLPFGWLKSVTHERNEHSHLHPCFIVFDMVFLNGRSLTSEPLSTRISLMEKVFQSERGRLDHVQRSYGRTLQDVIDALDRAIADHEEGLVLKNPSRIYQPAQRLSDTWIKIKAEYYAEDTCDLDLIVVGGDYAKGRRHKGGLSSFLCAVAESAVPGKDPSTFLSFCRIGGGFNDQDLNVIREKLRPHLVPFDKNVPPPAWLRVATTKPDVIIEPSKSIVFQVKANSIVPSTEYATSCSLRFPRFVALRDDKPWYDCLTTIDLNQLRRQAEGQLASGHVRLDEMGLIVASKKRAPTLHRTRQIMLGTQFIPADVSKVVPIDELFSGKEFFVMHGDSNGSMTKQGYETMLVAHGATITQHVSPATFAVVTDTAFTKSARIQNLVHDGRYDIILVAWIKSCIEQRRLVPYRLEHFVFAKDSTRLEMAERLDPFGDAYREQCSVDQVQALGKKIKIQITDKEAKALQEEMETRYMPPALRLHPCRKWSDWRVFIKRWDASPLSQSRETFVRCLIASHGGQCVSDESTASHRVLIHSEKDEFEWEGYVTLKHLIQL